jgi:hypothetical protein
MPIRRAATAAFLSLAAATLAAAPATTDIDARVAELLARMTLEEKIAQMRPVARRLSLTDDTSSLRRSPRRS